MATWNVTKQIGFDTHLPVIMKPVALSLFVVLCSLSSALAQDEERRVITQAQALKAGPEKLVEILGDESEAGMDHAAILYSIAKRLETETALAKKDLLLVQALDELRGPLMRWEDEVMTLGYITAGGGTMWGHQSARNSAGREDFLATIAAQMPFEAPENPGPHAGWSKVKEKIEKMALSKDAAEFDPEAPKNFADQKEKLLAQWQEFEFALYSLPTKLADAAVKYAEQALAMLEPEEG